MINKVILIQLSFLYSFKSRRCIIVSIVLAALVVGALVAVLVTQPWAEHPPDHPRYRRAAVAANGPECASIGR